LQYLSSVLIETSHLAAKAEADHLASAASSGQFVGYLSLVFMPIPLR
jgi:hypothetical protein